MHLWDFLFYQSTITLKLLQPYNQTPKMWDHTELKVPFDHNKIPLLTLSTKFIVLEKYFFNIGVFVDSVDVTLDPSMSTITVTESIYCQQGQISKQTLCNIS